MIGYYYNTVFFLEIPSAIQNLDILVELIYHHHHHRQHIYGIYKGGEGYVFLVIPWTSPANCQGGTWSRSVRIGRQAPSATLPPHLFTVAWPTLQALESNGPKKERARKGELMCVLAPEREREKGDAGGGPPPTKKKKHIIRGF